MTKTCEIRRSGATAIDDPVCFNRLHWALEPVTHAAPGDYIVFETRDAFDNQFDWNTTSDQVPACDLNRVHPMTGPVYIDVSLALVDARYVPVVTGTCVFFNDSLRTKRFESARLTGISTYLSRMKTNTSIMQRNATSPLTP